MSLQSSTRADNDDVQQRDFSTIASSLENASFQTTASDFVAITTSVASTLLPYTTNTSEVVTNTTEAATADVSENSNWFQLAIICVKGFIFGTIIIGAVLGNALVIISVRRNRKLRYVTVYRIPVC